MMVFLSRLAGTVCLRPYVFVFLGIYLLLATLEFGFGRALVFLILGYLLAWLAELSSIHTGFPFGLYYYIPATASRELWVAGIPLMDSLSYVFLAYASFTLALLALAPGRWQGLRFRLAEGEFLPSWKTTILGAVLMMSLDVVIDPLALRGYRWFLGQIYGYPEPGWFHGIPVANFLGWFLVALLLIRLLQGLVTCLPAGKVWDWGRRSLANQAFLGPALYGGILLFNLAVAFGIGEYTLFLTGVFIYLPFFTLLTLKLLPSGTKLPE